MCPETWTQTPVELLQFNWCTNIMRHRPEASRGYTRLTLAPTKAPVMRPDFLTSDLAVSNKKAQEHPVSIPTLNLQGWTEDKPRGQLVLLYQDEWRT